MAIECPKCGLFNPDTAVRCDCGYDFVLRQQVSATNVVSKSGAAVITGAASYEDVSIVDIKCPSTRWSFLW